MTFVSSLVISLILGLLIENMTTKYLLIDLDKESKVARGPGKMRIFYYESVMLDLLFKVYALSSILLFYYLFLPVMCNSLDCPHGFCDPMTQRCMPYKKGIF